MHCCPAGTPSSPPARRGSRRGGGAGPHAPASDQHRRGRPAARRGEGAGARRGEPRRRAAPGRGARRRGRPRGRCVLRDRAGQPLPRRVRLPRRAGLRRHRELGLFWSAASGWPLVWDQDEETAIQSPHGGTKIAWGGGPAAPRTGRDQQRLELAVAAADLRAEVDRLVSLGATRLEDGGDGAVLLADPDGGEFRVGPGRPPAGDARG